MAHLYPNLQDHRTVPDLATNPSRLVEQMPTAVTQPHLQNAIDDAEQGIGAGRWVEHAEVEARLRRWAGDDA